MQRRSVDLPEPEAPIRHTTSCESTERLMPLSTSSSPNRLWTASISSSGIIRAPHPRLARLRARRGSRRSASAGSWRDEDDRDERDRREVEVVAGVDLRLAEGVDRADDEHERRVLLQADEVAEQRREELAQRLRHDDVAPGLRGREAERLRGRRLAPMHASRCRRGRPPRRRRSSSVVSAITISHGVGRSLSTGISAIGMPNATR